MRPCRSRYLSTGTRQAASNMTNDIAKDTCDEAMVATGRTSSQVVLLSTARHLLRNLARHQGFEPEAQE